jgi:hypothetical protein
MEIEVGVEVKVACVKDMKMNDGRTEFTSGKVYKGEFFSDGFHLKNDSGEVHYVTQKCFVEYFEV